MIGKTLLHYEIREQIGKGGMGEVYAAHDTKLGRDVALKILPAELTGDPERELRFQREARALASLQHPHVASVYGFEEADGVRFLVMELVSGRELTQRMQGGPVETGEARRIARQLAAGLEAAHESGIVHRDLKPSNIMVTDEGEVKILDFGLAQAWFGDSPDQAESSAMPTITAAMTQVGAILGTAAYMSPEQARGAHVDRRADIWAFGVILFEMLTGEQLFQGETISDTLAAVLRKDPEWDRLPVDEAPALCRLIERCLERNPKQRLRDIGEARIFLQDGGESSSHLSFSLIGAQTVPEPAGRGGVPVAVAAVVVVVALLAGGWLGWQVLARPAAPPVLHAMIPPPAGTEYELNGTAPGPVAVSPDGSKIAFSARGADGTVRLHLRHLDQGESVAMSGTENAAYPFWSPGSDYIGYFDAAENRLRKVAAAGGPPVTLCAAPNVKGGSWNADDVIIFAPSHDTGIHRVPALGGEPVALTHLADPYDSHRHPRFLPDGRHFVYTARSEGGPNQANGIFLASLDTTETPRLVGSSDTHADVGGGYLLTVREGVLMATPFDAGMEAVATTGTPVVEDILSLPGAAVSIFAVAPSGMLVYQTGSAATNERILFWRDLTTRSVTVLGEPGPIAYPVISPDGTQALVETIGESDSGIDLWLADLGSGLRTRFTFGPTDEIRPRWTPDGAEVVYTVQDGGQSRFVVQPVEGQGGEAIIFESEDAIRPSDIGPDGKTLLFERQIDASSDFAVWRLDLTGAEPEPQEVFKAADGHAGGAVYSPDGSWIALHAASANGFDIFVIPAGGGVRKWQVSTDGRVYPIWNADGSEIWTLGFDGSLLVFDVDGTGSTFRVRGSRVSVDVTGPAPEGNSWDLDPNGGRILETGQDPDDRNEVSLIQFVTDWQRALVR
jgi:Tol biopolymer transport system component/predicted Ser/Thr protein kinase